jgi:hypothetical protein
MDIQVYWEHTGCIGGIRAYKGHTAYKDILAGRIHMDILYEYGRTRPN